MKRSNGQPFLGPVGLLFASLGYTLSVVIARLFVTLESYCTQLCPVFRIEGFRFHHLYYGLILIAISTGVLWYAGDVRTRWDSALIAGIGLGLVADEVGLLILKLSYWNIISLGVLAGGGLVLYLATLYGTLKNGVSEFRFLDRYQLLATLGLLLAFTGFLYFDRPIRIIVEAAALGSWLSAVILIAKYGRKHIWVIRHTALNYKPRQP
jgi:hypothetical protein